MRIEQFIQVMEIAKTGSLNKAAQNLFLSQPSLSQSLKSFESEMGIRVFERGNNGMKLTEDGRQLLGIIGPLYQQLCIVPQLFHKERENAYKSFSVSNSYLKYVVNVYSEMVKKYSGDGLRTYYREVNGGEVLADVIEQRSDIGVLYITSTTKNFMLKMFENNEINYYKLLDDGYWIILGPENPLYHKKLEYVTPEELQQFPLVVYEEKQHSVPYSNVKLKNWPNQSVIQVNNRASMLDLVSATDAVNIGAMSQIPYKYTEFYQHLKTIELRLNDSQQEMGWICKRDYLPNEPARYFLTRLMEICTGRKPVRLPMD